MHWTVRKALQYRLSYAWPKMNWSSHHPSDVR
jgi:hypothetical protein